MHICPNEVALALAAIPCVNYLVLWAKLKWAGLKRAPREAI